MAKEIKGWIIIRGIEGWEPAGGGRMAKKMYVLRGEGRKFRRHPEGEVKIFGSVMKEGVKT